MLRKSIINSCFRQHTLNNLCKTRVLCNQNVRLSTFYPSSVPLCSPQGDNITSLSYRRYFNSLNETNSENAKTEGYEFDANLSKPSIDDIILRTTYKERCLQKIVDVLECSLEESLKLYKQYPFIFRENIDEAIKKINMLINNGISKRKILENVEILELEYAVLQSRISMMNEWGINDNQKSDFVVTLGLDDYSFHRNSRVFESEKDVVPYRNRLVYFSNLLQCSLSTMIHHATKYNHLILYDVHRIENVIKILLESGVSLNTIQNRIWLTRFLTEHIKNWQVSSNKNLQSNENKHKLSAIYFRRCLERDKNERLLLKPNQTRTEFLSQKLNVEIYIIEHLVATGRLDFDAIDLGNAVKVIDFLFSEGYKGIQICITPTILKRDVAFLQKRLNELRRFGGRDPVLYLLNYSEKLYQLRKKVIEESLSK